MADILPFQGLIYNLKKIGDLSLVTAPPYDVISKKSMPKYYEKHTYNVIRLELGDDSPGQDRYDSCAKYFNDWEKQEILIRDKEPAYYFYRVDFPLDGGQRKVRKGFIGLSRLEEFGSGMIFPHEQIHEEQKEDRLKVLKACQANLSPIFSLYSDPEQMVNGIFESSLSQTILFDYVDDDLIHHTLWALRDQNQLHQINTLMRKKVLFIADGHHRYKAALAYRNENLKKGKSLTGKEGFQYVMMYFCNLEDEGLTILPSHRLIFNLPRFDRITFEGELQKYFKRTDFPFLPENETVKRMEFFQALEREGKKGNTFGLYIHGNHYYTLFHIEKESDFQPMISKNIPTVLQKLDVIILHRFILKQLLGVEEKDQDQNRIQIIKNQNRALELVKKGSFQMVFLLNPPRIEEVQAVALEGEFMPQKSTFFYPKLPTGLVMNKIISNEIVSDLIP